MPTIRSVIASALARQRRNLRRKLADAEQLKAATNGTKWEAAEDAKRELRSLQIIIEEWKNAKNTKQH